MRMPALLLLVSLLLVPVTGAQDDSGWQALVEVAEVAEPRPDSVVDLPVAVEVVAEGVACPADVTFVGSFAVDRSDAAEGVILEAPGAFNVTFPGGPHPPTSPAAGRVELPAQLLVARYAAGGEESRFVLTATLELAESAGPCVPAPGTLTATAEVRFTTAEVPPGDPLYHPSHEAHGDLTFDAYLEPGERFEFTFEEPGRYPYHDHLDPERKGMIRVLKYAENGTAPPEVRITAAGFEPDDLAVPAGTTVVWINEDTQTRTVSADEQHGAKEFGLEPEDRAAIKAQDGKPPEETARESPAPGGALLVAALLASRWLVGRR